MTIAVVGAGAAGLMAAGTAAEQGAQVVLLEKNARVGRKLMITGKGRCNVTNHTDIETMLANVPGNPRFLRSALHAFPPERAIAFFEEHGVPLKTERGERVFPVSDQAVDIVDCLHDYVKSCGVKLRQETVTGIETADGAVCSVRTGKGVLLAERVIVATGGASYPATGSTGDGYRLAETLGHTVVPPCASLVPLEAAGDVCGELMGLSLRNVRLTAYEDGRKIYEEFGEMLFTHFGVSGPLVLSASAHMRRFGQAAYTLSIDLKPALDEKTLDKRLLSDFAQHQNNDFINALGDLLPRKLIPAIVRLSGIDPRVKVHSVTKKERDNLRRLLKNFPIEIVGPRPIAEAIVTAGGVEVREVSPKTMESKKVRGLYFAGEVLDVDAYTGGFNLQIAWATGYLAGLSASEVE